MDKTYQLRQAQLYIAEEIKRICDKNDIKFFLDFGSMLGAIRHKGFIPWDDDMDIGMVRDEYNKFIKIAPSELGDDFYLDEYSTNEECSILFAKVRLKGTKFVEEKGTDDQGKHNEIFVDIFPYIYIPDNYDEWKRDAVKLSFFGWAIATKAGRKPCKGDSIGKHLRFLPAVIVGKCLSFKTLRRIVGKYYSRWSDTNTMVVFSGVLYSFRKLRIPKVLLEETVEAEFEGHLFPILKEYDKYLTINYGDYMKLPPVEKRITHKIRVLDLGKYSFPDSSEE